MNKLGMRARHEFAFKALPKSQKLVDESEKRTPEQEKALTENARSTYLAAKAASNNLLMASIEANHRSRIADLIEKGRLPPLEA